MNVKISIITICYNAENEIERTMLSVVNQSFPDFEYIIVDGNSKDGTLKAIEGIICQYKSVTFKFVSEPDKGIYDAMNKGVKMASGEWVIMMNAGDMFSDNHVLENVFKNDIPSSLTFLYSDSYCRLADGSKFLGHSDFTKGQLLHQAIIYRRSLHSEHGLYIVSKPLIISDYLFFIRIPKEQVKKIDTIICLADYGGASQQFRSGEHALCADYIFRRRSFRSMLINIFLGRIKSILPMRIRLLLKSIVRRNQYAEVGN